jgi:hypothetical protein
MTDPTSGGPTRHDVVNAAPGPDDEHHPDAGDLVSADLPPNPLFHGPYDDDEHGSNTAGDPLNAYGRSEAQNTAEAAQLGQEASDDD